MEVLWQLAAEPVVCFDGDKAGEAAAARAIDLMLPNLREGRSFRFAFLPEGSDPDDLVRTKGRSALGRCLAGAHPLIDVLWQRELKFYPVDTPERRAAFEARLETLLGGIANTRVRDHYRREVKNRLFTLWRDQGSRRGRPAADAPRRAGRNAPPPTPSAYGFATVITLALVNHPWLLDRFAEEVSALDIKDRKLASLLGAVTGIILEDGHPAGERVAERIAASSHGKFFAQLMRDSAFKRVAFIDPESPKGEVAEQFADLIYRFRAVPNLTRELEQGADRLADMSEAEFERFAALQQQVASIGTQHAADDAGDRDAGRRFEETISRLKDANVAAQRGRRPEKQG
jgi:DNA primase